ncbi:MAG: prepilin peptidase [Actinomycetota bacterium]|nr:prepilin peptidase [Actinomycetota bacterium]
MLPLTVWAVLAGILGLAIGSFLNVAIYRVPAGESVVRPPSRCPSCASPIRNRHNIAVIGWMTLRGRCADCHAPISARYPLIEAATAALFVTITVRMHNLGMLAALPAYLYLAAAGLTLAMIDIDHKRLPNAIVLPSYLVVGLLLTTASLATHHWWALGRAAIGGAALFGFYFAIMFAYPAGMGFGDVKLAGVLGGVLAYVSFSTLVVGAFGGFLLGSIGGLAVLASGRGDRKTAIPFGPFMISAAVLAILFGFALEDLYFDALGR